MVLDRYLCLFFRFPWPINYNHASRCNKSSTHPLSIWFWLKIYFSFPWIHGVAYDHVLWALSCTNEWIITSEIIFKFDIDVTFWWRRSWIMRSVPSSWSWTPLNLVSPHFFQTPAPWWFVTSWPHFWWWTWNYLQRFLWIWKNLHLCMVFNSQHWTLSLVVWSDSSTTS